jgi:hypothetical protein
MHKELDLTLPFRLSGLSPGSSVELRRRQSGGLNSM